MPVPDGPVYQVREAPVPPIPLAVTLVVADGQMGEADAVAEEIDALEFTVTPTEIMLELHLKLLVAYTETDAAPALEKLTVHEVLP